MTLREQPDGLKVPQGGGVLASLVTLLQPIDAQMPNNSNHLRLPPFMAAMITRKASERESHPFGSISRSP